MGASIILGDWPTIHPEILAAYQNAVMQQGDVKQQLATQYVPPGLYDIPNVAGRLWNNGGIVTVSPPEEPAPDLSAEAALKRRFAGLDFTDDTEPVQAPIPRMQDIRHG